MNPKVNYLAVGIFVISICVATIIFSLWLAFGYGEIAQTTYLIDMNESVSGLSKDASVKFNGVTVGSIADISLGSDPSQVIIKIKVNEGTPITAATRATLMSQGLTGLSYLNLSGGNGHSEPLLPKRGQRYAIIPTNPSLLVRLDTTLNKLNTSIGKMGESVDVLLGAENQNNIRAILKNLATATKAAADHSNDLAQSLQQMPKMLAAANQTFDAINRQTLPNANTSLLMLTTLLPNLSDFAQELSENPNILLRGMKTSQLGPGEEMP
jgi:phospholipid/cholesterol/gamma-HCH transport system substrate-binding protein